MAPAALAFDLDGTVWDSYPWYAELLAQLIGGDPNEFEASLRSGSNLMSMVDSLVGRSRFYREAGRQVARIHLFPAVRETLDELRDRRVPLGVATNLPAPLVSSMLDGLGLRQYFGAVVDARTRPGKPNPRPLLVCYAGLNLDPTPAAYYVGDRRVDQSAAARAGLSFAWAAYGYVDDVDHRAAAARLTAFSQILTL
jgi:AHBA synthesis associated protein